MAANGKIAIVCGGAGGIGTASTLRLAQDGWFPVVLDRDEAAGKAALKSLGDRGHQGQFVAVELTDKTKVQKVIADMVAEHRRVDALVNITGGVIYPKMIQDFSLDEWRRVIDVNLKTAFISCQAVIKTMKERKSGVIINTSSNLGFTGGVTRTAYSAAKAGVVAFTRSLAREVAPYNIRANVIVPGLTATKRVMGDFTPDRWTQANKSIPMGRTANPEETAEGIAFLASDLSQRMTGQTLHVNGGLVMY
jgi:NAD(P)-dependent dehydrogenase (short-subunit alcohol dehydrogenase family)